MNGSTLIMRGEQDITLPLANLIGPEQYVPILTVKKVPGASHSVIHEQPKPLTEDINSFID